MLVLVICVLIYLYPRSSITPLPILKLRHSGLVSCFHHPLVILLTLSSLIPNSLPSQQTATMQIIVLSADALHQPLPLPTLSPVTHHSFSNSFLKIKDEDITQVCNTIARGDLIQKSNTMVNKLGQFVKEVTCVLQEVGTGHRRVSHISPFHCIPPYCCAYYPPHPWFFAPLCTMMLTFSSPSENWAINCLLKVLGGLTGVVNKLAANLTLQVYNPSISYGSTS